MQKKVLIHTFCILLTSYFYSHGQAVGLQDVKPVIIPSAPSPIISDNDSKHYFLRRFFSRNGSFGGLVEKDQFTFNDSLLLFYEETPLSFLNVEQQNALISIDSYTVYYHNRNPSNNKFKGIFFSNAASSEGSLPQKLVVDQFDLTDVHSFHMNPTSDVLLFSLKHKQGQGQEDLYVSTFENGQWASPINLGETINTEGSEISPFLSTDKTTLYFSSTGHDSLGKGDIFISKRLYNSWKVWSAPKNLGTAINSPNYEAYFNIVDDTTAYFISNKYGQGQLWQAYMDVSPVNPFRNLQDEREYLSNQEMTGLLGVAIDSTILFSPNQSELSSQSKELLWFVANNIIRKPDIMINIVFLPDVSTTVLKERIIGVSEYLNFLGISRNRISSHVLSPESDNVENTDAIFNFYLKK